MALLKSSDIKDEVPVADEKPIMEEIVPEEKWPRLTVENNKSKINHSAFSLRLDDAQYIPTELLDRALRALNIEITNEAEAVAAGMDPKDIRKIKIDKLEWALDGVVNMGKPLIGVENLILTRLLKEDEEGKEVDPSLETFFFMRGQLRIIENYVPNGKLQRRTIHDEEAGSYEETWSMYGLLTSRFWSESEGGGFIGPHYDLKWDRGRPGPLQIIYWISGHPASKQEWEKYVTASKTLVKEQGTLNYDVAALINSYTDF